MSTYGLRYILAFDKIFLRTVQFTHCTELCVVFDR